MQSKKKTSITKTLDSLSGFWNTQTLTSGVTHTVKSLSAVGTYIGTPPANQISRLAAQPIRFKLN